MRLPQPRWTVSVKVANTTTVSYTYDKDFHLLSETYANGDIVANYEYDAWGKVLTADTDIAKLNPIR